MKVARLTTLVLAATALLAVPAAAKGEFNLVTVTGPDWMGEIDIVDPALLGDLDMGHFMDYDREISPPTDLGRAYLVSRGYEKKLGERFYFDRILYFPGEPAVAYYLEIVNGSGPYDGRWYAVNEAGSEALRAGLTDKGARLPDPPSAAPSIWPVVPDLRALGLAGFGLAALGGLVGYRLGGRRAES